MISGCADREPEQMPKELIKPVNATGVLTAYQAPLAGLFKYGQEPENS